MLTQSLIAVCLLSTTAMAADASVNAKVSVAHAKWRPCGKNLGVKLSLQVQIENASQAPLVLGRVYVEQEHIYRKGQKGTLELVGTTATPDEFTSDPAGPFADIEEKKLAGHTSETLTIIHMPTSPRRASNRTATLRESGPVSTSPMFVETAAYRNTGAVQLRLLSRKSAICSSQPSVGDRCLAPILAKNHDSTH